MGASLGGVSALKRLVINLSDDLPPSIFVALHTGSRGRSALDRVLSSAGPLPGRYARDGEPIERGRIYLGLADRHLLPAPNRVRVSPNTVPVAGPALTEVGWTCGGKALFDLQ